MTSIDSRAHARRFSPRFVFIFSLVVVGLIGCWGGGLIPLDWPMRFLTRASSFQTQPFRAYVANTGSNTVTVVDLATGLPIASPINVGREPSAIIASLDQQYVYVANSQANTVSVIDTATNTVIDTVQLRATARATGLALSFDLPRLYVSHDSGNNVYVVNAENNNTIGLPIGVQGRPSGLVWTDNPRNRLYVSTPNNQGITSVNLALIVTRDVIATGRNPFGAALASDGAAVYVADLDESKVSVIDTNSNRAVRSFVAGNRPDSLVLTPDRRRLVVASLNTPEAAIINPADGSLTATVPTGSSVMTGRPGLNRVASAPDGLSVVVANEDDDSITIVDLRTNIVRNVASSGDQPTGVVVVGRAAVCDPARTTIDFGDVRLGSGGTEQELRVANRGTDVLQITAANVDNPMFEIGGLPLSIAPRETGRILVRFNPVVLGEQRGTLSLQTNDPDPSRCIVQLRGFGRSPICTLTPAAIDFGVVRIAQQATFPVVLGNAGNERLVITQVDSTDAQFGLASPGLPVSVEPGAFQTVLIGFTPSAIRVQSALLRFIGNDPDPNRCVLSAQGIGQGPVCQAPAEVDFGEVPVFQTGFATIAVSNVGDESLVINNVTIDDPQFTIGAASFPVVLGPNSSFGLVVRFTPIRVEMRTALLRIFSNDPGPRCMVQLRGSGKGPICSLPQTTDFGDVALRRSEDQTLQVSNLGNDSLTVFNAFVSGGSAFQLRTSSFPLVIGPGGEAGIEVRFTPTFLGFQSATLVVQTNDPVNPTCTTRLEGTGVVPPVLAYVANNGSGSLSVVNVETGENQPPAIPVQSGPTGIAKSPNGQFLYVTNFSSNTVSIIDAFRNEVVDTLFIGGGPLGVAMNPSGDRVFVCTFSANSVTVISTATNQVLRTLRPVSGSPAGIVVSPDGRRLYVTTPGDRTITVLDPNTGGNPVVTTIPVGPNTTALAISPDGGTVYASDTDENVVRVISTSTNMVVRTINAGDGAESLVVSRDGNRLYVVNLRANTVSVISVGNGMTLASIPVGRSNATARLGPNRVALSDDGRFGVAANADDSTVTIFNLADNMVLRTVSVGRTPLGISIVGP